LDFILDRTHVFCFTCCLAEESFLEDAHVCLENLIENSEVVDSMANEHRTKTHAL
jgi:hypothetical protein